jgi:hypothetical protein
MVADAISFQAYFFFFNPSHLWIAMPESETYFNRWGQTQDDK